MKPTYKLKQMKINKSILENGFRFRQLLAPLSRSTKNNATSAIDV